MIKIDPHAIAHVHYHYTYNEEKCVISKLWIILGGSIKIISIKCTIHLHINVMHHTFTHTCTSSSTVMVILIIPQALLTIPPSADKCARFVYVPLITVQVTQYSFHRAFSKWSFTAKTHLPVCSSSGVCAIWGCGEQRNTTQSPLCESNEISMISFGRAEVWTGPWGR